MNNLRFAHVGMDHVVCANRALCAIIPGTRTSKRYVESAKKANKYVDATVGRTTKSYLLMDEGTVIATILNPKTLMARLNGVSAYEQDNKFFVESELETEIAEEQEDNIDESN